MTTAAIYPAWAETIKLFGEEYPLRAEVCSISGFSSHADRDELTRFLSHLSRPPARTFLVHGEESQSRPLAEHLQRQGFPRVDVPASGENFTI